MSWAHVVAMTFGSVFVDSFKVIHCVPQKRFLLSKGTKRVSLRDFCFDVLPVSFVLRFDEKREKKIRLQLWNSPHYLAIYR